MHNYITVNHIIFRLKAMFNVNIETMRNIIIEMIGWAIAEVGFSIGYYDDVVEMTVDDYRTKPIDSDILYIKNIINNGELLKNNKQNGFLNTVNIEKIQNDIIGILKSKNCCDREPIDPECIEKDDCGKPLKTPYDSIMSVGENYNILTKDLFYILSNKPLTKSDDFWWYQEGNVIKTNLDKGVVNVHCKKMLTDEEGYPMINNSPDYINYLLYTVLFNLIAGGYRHPTISFEMATMYKDRYISKARNEKIISDFNPKAFEKQWNLVLNKYK